MTTVKHFHSNLPGAPTLSNVAGNLISVLNACLVDGWGSGTVDSLVISGGVATVTRAAGHPFEPDTIALISGATVSGGSVNGERRVLSTTTTTYTFDATGISNQTATGTITHKLAPAGWTKPYSGTNLAVYRNDSTEGNGAYLRVDDTGTTNARVVGYGSMSDVNTGTEPFPTNAQVSGGAYIAKANGATNRPWVIVADGRTVYVAVAYHSTNSGHSLGGFGDILSRKAADPYSSFLNAYTSDRSGAQPGNDSQDMSWVHHANSGGFYLRRGVAGLGQAVNGGRYITPVTMPSGVRQSGGDTGVTYPNLADNGLLLAPYLAADSWSLRGRFPGLYFCCNAVGTAVFATGNKIDGVDTLTGRRLMAIVGAYGPAFLDITGPWE